MIRLLTASLKAIFAASDITALGAVEPLQVAGIWVPRDVCVVGFESFCGLEDE